MLLLSTISEAKLLFELVMDKFLHTPMLVFSEIRMF